MFEDKLILDLGNYFPQQGNLLPYKSFNFNGGEPHIKIDVSGLSGVLNYPKAQNGVVITCRATSFNAIGEMLVAKNALDNLKIKNLDLFLPYFPGARQDRINHAGEPFTAKIYADLINSQNFNNVYVLDPHSLVTNALLNNLTVLNHVYYFKQFLDKTGNFLQSWYLVKPDNGAEKRIFEIAEYFPNSIADIIHCTKKRNTATGQITGYEVYLPLYVDPSLSMVIADDICEGGATFLSLAERLKEKDITNPLYLYVSHGIFSKSLEVLSAFEKIGTTDSFRTIIDDKLIQIKF